MKMKSIIGDQRGAARVAALLCLWVLVACTDQDLVTVSKALNDTAQALSVFQTAVIAANAQKPQLISDPSTAALLQAAVRVNQAGRQAVQITRGINQLAPADRANLLAILRPVIDSLQAAQTPIAGITDPQTQKNIQAGLVLIQTSLNVAQIALASKGQ